MGDPDSPFVGKGFWIYLLNIGWKVGPDYQFDSYPSGGMDSSELVTIMVGTSVESDLHCVDSSSFRWLTRVSDDVCEKRSSIRWLTRVSDDVCEIRSSLRWLPLTLGDLLKNSS